MNDEYHQIMAMAVLVSITPTKSLHQLFCLLQRGIGDFGA